ncbi:MAG: HAD family hydrolase, partial [Thermoplasmata archaeon]|nr:HAD family hydrolase [Thermoplasmata archaeon]
GNYQIVVRGLARVHAVEWLAKEPYLVAQVGVSPEKAGDATEMEALRREVLSIARRLVAFLPQVPEGVVDMLDVLKKDHKLGVATMRHGRITGEIIEGMGMSHFFDILVGVDDTEKPKPHPEHVLTACKLLEVEPEAAVMVGDTIYDVLSGKGAGCYTIGIDWGSGKREDLLENGADHVASTMDGLLEHVLQLP